MRAELRMKLSSLAEVERWVLSWAGERRPWVRSCLNSWNPSMLPPKESCKRTAKDFICQYRMKLFLSSLLLLVALSAGAQNYTVDWYKISGGGGTSTGGTYQVSGTIGQPDASGAMSGGQYSVTGGFWALIQVVQTPGAPTLYVSHSGNTVTVYWQDVAGWNLVLRMVISIDGLHRQLVREQQSDADEWDQLSDVGESCRQFILPFEESVGDSNKLARIQNAVRVERSFHNAMKLA